ncbi:unnamed protein product [Allacma fusca]|uniref:Uncharacterized protein n=1 Tax=Allacma fusca TaxID=39272 RepID=A0A8J2LEE0_9HEXA|nr:unnamed protein product [Allacma fusca]
MISSAEPRGNRLKTNVIDYRPVTAPLMSPRTFSRPSSPTSMFSSAITREELYKSPLEKAENDMDKLLKNIPGLFTTDDAMKDINANFAKNSFPKVSKGVKDLAAVKSMNYSCLFAPRPLSKGGSRSTSGNSTPSTSRREENSLESHTKRIGFGVTTSGRTFPNSQVTDHCRSPPITRKNWRTSDQSVTSPPKTAPACSSNDYPEFKNSTHKPIQKPMPKRFNQRSTIKRSGVSEEEEKENPIQRKDVFLKHVFVVNGSVVTFKSFGYENFTNWFGDETMLSKEKKPDDFFRRELDVWGFTNREISMKLFCGNKLLIEANRPVRGKLPAKKFKETIILPYHLSVESLIVCRNKSGRIILEELPRCALSINTHNDK